ncbi:hypothetical protein IWQ60_009664 [Tieghemiomyces parasiticus]|uniref:Uncharacterized protein n=1 Tax=Tieghemiomyces parasiticus TaxID=78921 RepID=A0A9W7ZSZ5_9FUNG|nr:hypothetical protein IWQ60_009664 [Tieghemiomyces parasiticus]
MATSLRHRAVLSHVALWVLLAVTFLGLAVVSSHPLTQSPTPSPPPQVVAHQARDAAAAVASSHTPIRITYTLDWFDPNQGQFGAEITFESDANLDSQRAFIPQGDRWSLELQWPNAPPPATSVRVTGFSSNAGTLESAVGLAGRFALTDLTYTALPITYHVNFDVDPSTATIDRLLPAAGVLYDGAKPGNGVRNQTLTSSRNQYRAVVGSKDGTVKSLPTKSPSNYTQLSRQIDEADRDSSGVTTTKTQAQSSFGESHLEQSTQSHVKHAQDAENNPYGTVLMHTPVGLYLYSAVTGVALLFHAWGLLFRLRSRYRPRSYRSFLPATRTI